MGRGKINLLLFIGLFSQTAFGKFLPIDEVPGNWKKVVDSVKHSLVRFQSPGESICTGTVISDEGHVLTAMHCFHECLKRAKAFKVRALDKPYYYAEVDLANKPRCFFHYKDYDFEANDNLNQPKESDYAEIVAAGNGLVLLNPQLKEIDTLMDFYQGNKELLPQLRELGIGRIIGDFVIFKSAPFKKYSCSQIDKGPPPKGELLSLSFPHYTYSRKEGVDPNGRSLYASLGHQSPMGLLASDSTFVDELLTEHSSEDVEQAYSHKRDILWSNIDVVMGSSGSPVYSSEGKLVGVTTFNICSQNRARYEGCKNSSASLSINKIHKDLLLGYGPKKVDELFSCNQK